MKIFKTLEEKISEGQKISSEIMDFRISVGFLIFYPERYWFFHFRKYNNVKGFILRILGMDFNIREGDSLKKLISINTKIQNEKLKV